MDCHGLLCPGWSRQDGRYLRTVDRSSGVTPPFEYLSGDRIPSYPSRMPRTSQPRTASRIHGSMDNGVQAGRISPSGIDCDSLDRPGHSSFLVPLSGICWVIHELKLSCGGLVADLKVDSLPKWLPKKKKILFPRKSLGGRGVSRNYYFFQWSASGRAATGTR